MDLNADELKSIFDDAGIVKGDILYVASDVTRLMNSVRKRYGLKTSAERELFLNMLVDALQDVVSPLGTLLFPVFSWDFCKGELFDIKHTLGKVGAFHNWILLNRSDFLRTAHPMYSFVVWGKDADMLLTMDNVDAFSADSPFGYLHKTKAKMLLIDVHLDQSFTFMHYIEEQLNVPYRYLKNFRSFYIDREGEITERSYTMFVRDLAIELKMHLPDYLMSDSGAMKEIQWMDVPFRILDFEKSYAVCKEDFLHNQGKMCYDFHGYDWKLGERQTHPNDLDN